jgi:NOL1/NOP2/sun family putative RNA methylase
MPVLPTVPISSLFLDRMSHFLGDEFPAFAESLNAAPRSGLRINTLKLTKEQFQKITPFVLGEPVTWASSAFLMEGEEKPGKHPYHQAGLYYLQDPSAMSPAELLAPQPGERVLDLAAAPGGKTTQLAALMQGRGLLVANEIKTKRVGHLVQNMERWGAGNVVIANESPENLADHFGAYFDRVLVDAPCSGEGMFRKDIGARADWSLEMVHGCAARQVNILRVAGKLVRPGGFLLYSTCTFAPEENEGVIAAFLGEFKDFEVAGLSHYAGFMAGRPDWLDGNDAPQLEGAVRLFPHRVEGEGHFACCLRRKAGKVSEQVGNKQLSRLSRTQSGYWQEFCSKTIQADLDDDRLRVVGDRLYYIPVEMPDFGWLRVIHPGVWLGLFKKDRFEPAHPLALYFKQDDNFKSVSLPAGSPELSAYLRGESIPGAESGWAIICVDGFPLGWSKGVQGTLKNHYPRGWILPGMSSLE